MAEELSGRVREGATKNEEQFRVVGESRGYSISGKLAVYSEVMLSGLVFCHQILKNRAT